MEKEIETRFERNEEDIRKLFRCTDETNRWQGKYGEKIDNIADSIKALLDKPQKRWDMVVASAISAVVGGGIGAAILSIFGGVL